MEVIIKEIFDTIYLHEKDMTARQIEFINSIKRSYKKWHTLSEKQIAILNDIKKYHSKTVPRYSMKFHN